MICTVCRREAAHVTSIKGGGAICDDCLRDGCLTGQERRARDAEKRKAVTAESRRAHKEAVERGKATEDLVETAAEALELQQKAWIKKRPTPWRPIGNGRMVPGEKSTVDFDGFDREGCHIEIEAKRCEKGERVVYLTRVKPHQRSRLDLVDAHHGRAMLLADFPERGEWWLVPWRIARDLVSVDPDDPGMAKWSSRRGTLVI